jgi:protein-S-isoprenylcysteine O-methyltransferase Ste14
MKLKNSGVGDRVDGERKLGESSLGVREYSSERQDDGRSCSARASEPRSRIRTDMDRIGGRLFKYRSYTAIPLFVVWLCVFWKEYEADAVIWTVGPLLVLCGSALRLWAVRHIGRSARTRGAKAKKLVTTGPYVVMRNPLYFGNMVIGFGACILSELMWMIPVFLVLFGFQYACIIAWEQSLLRKKFGPAYDEYISRVPAFFPGLSSIRYAFTRPALSIRASLHRERDTLVGIAFMLLAFLAKELADGTLIHTGV